ncbi:MAG TPA: zinc finger domain-containing protein [archaeon]|nr:zinc finger domain-containing protein [archaeon]HLD80455.1 zinc finger domain-containing protein [archaeon]
MKGKICSSCGSSVLNKYTEFKCPGCGKNEIVRCEKCRRLTNEYKCKDCGFSGP